MCGERVIMLLKRAFVYVANYMKLSFILGSNTNEEKVTIGIVEVTIV